MTRSPRNSPRRAAARDSEASKAGNDSTSVGRSFPRHLAFSVPILRSPQSRTESRARFARASKRRLLVQPSTRARGGAPFAAIRTSTAANASAAPAGGAPLAEALLASRGERLAVSVPVTVPVRGGRGGIVGLLLLEDLV